MHPYAATHIHPARAASTSHAAGPHPRTSKSAAHVRAAVTVPPCTSSALCCTLSRQHVEWKLLRPFWVTRGLSSTERGRLLTCVREYQALHITAMQRVGMLCAASCRPCICQHVLYLFMVVLCLAPFPWQPLGSAVCAACMHAWPSNCLCACMLTRA
jgi:hypothetical protein